MIGFCLPFVTTYLTAAKWPEWGKFLACVAAAGAVGFVQLWAAGSLPGLTWDNALSVIGTTYIASGVVFWGLINTTGLKAWLEAHGVK